MAIEMNFSRNSVKLKNILPKKRYISLTCQLLLNGNGENVLVFEECNDEMYELFVGFE